jgi:3' terminal RNA ribose 2'-O-methyltransferase Hen1
VLLTITTTLKPATDLGFLLVKHPDRVHEFTVSTGKAYVCYPEAGPERCTAALVLDIDPAALRTRGRERPDDFTLGRFVNDRPYAASSLLSAAIAQVFRSALRGTSKERPDLVAKAVPLELRLPALRCRGGAALAEEMFGPLGWSVTATPIGDSLYVDLTLTGTQRVADALNQIYVLLPVLDDAKHYWVAPDEVDKLLRAGTGWLADHPRKSLIARRYLAHQRSLTNIALARLTEDEAAETEEDAELPGTAKKEPLAHERRRAVIGALGGAQRVLDLGCGGGALLGELAGDRRYTEIVGVDVSTVALAMAGRRLRLDRLPERQQGRIRLIQGALTYRDDRLKGYDAAVLMEVIEHLDEPRLPALADAVFGHARPATVIVTTPNVEYNVRYEGLTGMRHHDHRFEWNRAAFAAWCAGVAADYGYSVAVTGVGDADPEVGAPTQMAVFTA